MRMKEKIAEIIAEKSLCPLKNHKSLCGVKTKNAICQICNETANDIIDVVMQEDYEMVLTMTPDWIKVKAELNRIPDSCCICGKPLEGHGNNPYPLKKTGRCCDKCNIEKVIPARILKENDHHEIIDENK